MNSVMTCGVRYINHATAYMTIRYGMVCSARIPSMMVSNPFLRLPACPGESLVEQGGPINMCHSSTWECFSIGETKALPLQIAAICPQLSVEHFAHQL